MEITALIMAGGRGERFWPKSRKRLPKQFLSLTGDGKTMIQLTVERISPMVPMKNIYIATNQDYKKLVLEQLPEIPEENILCEPAARNTAPCIGLGAVHIEKRFGDALMLVLPSDHLIKQNKRFLDILKRTQAEPHIPWNSLLKNQIWKLPKHIWRRVPISGTAVCSSGKFLLY